MPNTFLLPSVIAREALVLLESNLVAASIFSRSYEPEFMGNLKVGDTITVRRRTKPVITEYDGVTVTPTSIVESGVPLILEKHFDANIQLTSKEMTLELQDFSSQVLEPYMLELAETIDTYALSKIIQVGNVAPNALPGTLPSNLAGMAAIERVANDLKFPRNPRAGIVSAEFKESLMGVASFVEADKRGDDGTALRDSSLGRLMTIDTFMDQNVDTTTHTTGTSISGTVNGVHAIGATTIVLAGMGATLTVVEGDILQFADGNNYGVSALATSNAGGDMTVVLFEPIREAFVGAEAVVVYDGGGNTFQDHGVLMHPNAFAMVVVPLALPRGAADAGYIQNRGFGIRFVYTYDKDLKSDVLSLDILVGAKLVDGRLAARLPKNI